MSSSKKDKSKRIAQRLTSERMSMAATFATSIIGMILVVGGLGTGIGMGIGTNANFLQNTFAQSEEQANTNTTESPLAGYDIHAKINKHDASDLSHKMDHYCKLSETIVAVCQLYDGEGPDAKLAQIEFIITEDQYDQLPDKEKPNWHNHAIELTPQRGAPEFVDLPPGVNGTELLSTLQTTYGKVITLWEPSEELPQSEPYAFWVDSPFALGQDKNDNLHNEWPSAGSETE
jgi:Protein of unknown function (DUF1264)